MIRLPMVLAWQMLCGAAVAQTAAPPAATSPLGSVSDTRVAGTGLPLGATEITSPGVSPLFMALPGTGATSGISCANPDTSSASPSGTAGIFDGGGLSLGTAAAPPASGQSLRPPRMNASGGCGSADDGSAAPASGSAVRIPLGATQLGNPGVSPADALPTIGVAPVTGAGIAIATPSTPVIAPAVPLDTVGGISSLPPVPVPGLVPGNVRRH